MKLRLKFRPLLACLTVAFFVLAPLARADRTKLKPGMNSFSPQQDIELGRKVATEIEQKTQLCNAPKVDAYLTKLGMKLVENLNTRGVEYPWEFHCVNDKSINAFALPGGFVFVNRGAIEAADNEAQLAGVMAHELSHVALRHGTNQATKAQYAQLGSGILGVAGGIFGGTAGAAAAGVGQLAFGSVLLKYSRGAETQADVMGTQVLFDSGYDPRALAAFFENLNAQTAGKNPPEFFSDHPNPDHRIERVEEEIQKLGGAPEGARKDSAEFEAVKKEVAACRHRRRNQPPRRERRAAAARLPRAQLEWRILRGVSRHWEWGILHCNIPTIGGNTGREATSPWRRKVASLIPERGRQSWRMDFQPAWRGFRAACRMASTR